jgi:hypothetical protein
MRRLCPCLLVVAVLALCVGRSPARDEKPAAGIVVDKEKRTITIDAKIAPRKIDDPRYEKIYPIEIVACYPFPKGQKAHETVVTIEVKPSEVHKALEGLGLKPGKPVFGEVKEKATGPLVKIYLEFPGPDGEPKRVPIERTIIDQKTGKPMPKAEWRFTGSTTKQPDPNKPDKVYAADETGTLICVFPVTAETVFQAANYSFGDQKFVSLETDKKLLPKEGTPVKLIIEVPAP